MTPLPNPNPFKPEDWNNIREAADRFEEAIRQGGEVDLTAFLPSLDQPLRPAILEELVKTELEYRWRAGRKVFLEEYLNKFSELGNSRTVSSRLIYEEYRVRQRFGDKPPLDGYRSRFPGQFDQLQQLLQQEPISALPPPSGPLLSSPVRHTMLPDLSDRELIHGYRLIRVLGQGSFGKVWEARAPGDIPAAVKIIDYTHSQAEIRLERSALEAIKRLNHPHLLKTYAFWLEPERLFIAMELVDGTLRDRLRACREKGLAGIPPDELLHYMHEAAEAIDYLHRHNLLHRDIKPDNILLINGVPPHAKVGDCGLVREQARTLATMSMAGTPAYIAPECWSRKSRPQSDQYSLAFTYAELRQGRRPFAGTDLVDLMQAHLGGEPDLAGLETTEAQVLRQALAKVPTERYASCLEMVLALEKNLGTPYGTFRPADPVPLVSESPPPRVEFHVPSEPTPLQPVPLSEDSFGQTPWVDAGLTSRPIPPTKPILDNSSKGPSLTGGWKQPGKGREEKQPSPAPTPTKKGGWIPWLAAGLLIAGLGAAGWFFLVLFHNGTQPTQPTAPNGSGGPIASTRTDIPPVTTQMVFKPEVTLKVPDNFRAFWLAAGQEKSFEFTLERKNNRGSVELNFDQVSGLEIDKRLDVDRARVTVKAAAKGRMGTRQGRLTATVPQEKDWLPGTVNGEEKFTLDFQISILPVGFEPSLGSVLEGSTKSDRHYSRIERTAGKEKVVFILLLPRGPEDQPAFYLMENKVWNALYREFAQKNSQAGLSTDWQRGGRAGGEDMVNPGPQLPVLRVTRHEAEQCAAWLGGQLPTTGQLDRAAGLGDPMGRTGPFRGSRVGVNRRREGPRDVDDPNSDDISSAGIRDLAGNGREWTRDVLRSGNLELSILRGRSYTAAGPLLFTDLEEQKDPQKSPTQDPKVASPYTGFRASIDLSSL